MSNKIRVGILFGGRSAEHEVSLQSAKNVIDALDRSKYEPVLVGIARNGTWFLGDASLPLLDAEDPRNIRLNVDNEAVTIVPSENRGHMVSLSRPNSTQPIDVLFPVLHGPYGEDGSVQGLARLANLPCVGAGILGSAIGMDKDVTKRLLKAGGIAVADFRVVTAGRYTQAQLLGIGETLGYPLFVKPANMGSSVGVSRVTAREELANAIGTALQYDTKVVVEATVQGREIECSVLGNHDPIASFPGEIVVHDGFYSYDAKYINENGATLSIPAKLDDDTVRQVQEIAIRTFELLDCRGMARVDMFLTPDNRIVVNEINTIPGFTKISMYPKLWEASGIGYRELVDRLIQLAIEDFNEAAGLKTER